MDEHHSYFRIPTWQLLWLKSIHVHEWGGRVCSIMRFCKIPLEMDIDSMYFFTMKLCWGGGENSIDPLCNLWNNFVTKRIDHARL